MCDLDQQGARVEHDYSMRVRKLVWWLGLIAVWLSILFIFAAIQKFLE